MAHAAFCGWYAGLCMSTRYSERDVRVTNETTPPMRSGSRSVSCEATQGFTPHAAQRSSITR